LKDTRSNGIEKEVRVGEKYSKEVNKSAKKNKEMNNLLFDIND